MAQKINPIGFRVGITKDWKSSWYAGKEYKDNLLLDQKIKRYLRTNLKPAGLESIKIERSFDNLVITLNVSRPGVVIGRGGSGIDALRKELVKLSNLRKVEINVVQVKDVDLSAELVAQNIAYQIERRRPYKRVMTYTAEKVMVKGAKGVKIQCKGRLGGQMIARSEHVLQGSIPLQTLKADIDYALAEAHTIAGLIGIKVWIFKGIKEIK